MTGSSRCVESWPTGQPYADLDSVMEGSFGPDSAMDTALSTYTPNIPWPRFGCPGTIRLNGEGTSAATPQVAAAAALWLEKYKNVLPRNWRRVEAVRHALFQSAAMKNDRKHFGNGVLRAAEALRSFPHLNRPQSDESTASFALLRLITGLGIDAPTPRETHVQSRTGATVAAEPGVGRGRPRLPERTRTSRGPSSAGSWTPSSRTRRLARAPQTCRCPLPRGDRPSATPNQLNREVVPDVVRALDAVPNIAAPPYRRLRVYTADPSLATRFDRAALNETTLHVRWENLTPPARNDRKTARRSRPARPKAGVGPRAPTPDAGVRADSGHAG